MAEEKRTLDLDELFGDARPVKVKWNGKVYELLRLDAFSPREIHVFQKMQMEAEQLQKAVGSEQLSVSSGQSAVNSDQQISELFDKMLKCLCPQLPVDDIPFLAKTRIITFYIEETQGKKALEVALSQQIGATSSAE